MDIVLNAWRHLEVDDVVHAGNVQTTRCYWCRNQNRNPAALEVTQRLLPLTLLAISTHTTTIQYSTVSCDKKVKGGVRLIWKPSAELCASPASWDHSTISHLTQINGPCLNHRQADQYSIYHRGIKGWVGLGLTGCIQRWFTCPQALTHPISNHLIATQHGVKLQSFVPFDRQVQHHNHDYDTKPQNATVHLGHFAIFFIFWM